MPALGSCFSPSFRRILVTERELHYTSLMIEKRRV